MAQLSKVLKVVCWAGSVRSDLPKIDGYYYPPVSGLDQQHLPPPRGHAGVSRLL